MNVISVPKLSGARDVWKCENGENLYFVTLRRHAWASQAEREMARRRGRKCINSGNIVEWYDKIL